MSLNSEESPAPVVFPVIAASPCEKQNTIKTPLNNKIKRRINIF